VSRRTLSSREVRLLAVLVLVAVVAVVGVASALAYECNTTGCCIAPFTPGSPSGEAISFDHYTISTASGQSNPSILTLSVRNTGISTVTLTSLSIKDLTSGTGPVSFQSTASVPRSGTTTVTVDTSASGFYFTPGHSYLLTVLTATHTQFTYSISY